MDILFSMLYIYQCIYNYHQNRQKVIKRIIRTISYKKKY